MFKRPTKLPKSRQAMLDLIKASEARAMVLVIVALPDKDTAEVSITLAGDDRRFTHPLAHMAIEYHTDSACPWCKGVPPRNIAPALIDPRELRT